MDDVQKHPCKSTLCQQFQTLLAPYFISQCCLTSLLPFAFSSLPPSRLQEQSLLLLALVFYEYDSLLLTAANNTIQWQYVAMVKQEYPNVLYTIKALICSYCRFHLLILTEKSKIAKSNYALFQKSDRYFKRQECQKSNKLQQQVRYTYIYIHTHNFYRYCSSSKVKTLFFYI